MLSQNKNGYHFTMSITAPRLPKSTQAVQEALQQLNHATAPDIMNWINRAAGDKKVSLTSVYRALTYLVNEAQIKPLNFNDGQVRYELNNQHMHHHHLVCTRCEKVQMLDSCPFDAVLNQLEGKFRVDYHNFEVFGLCGGCWSAS
jgi:Fe2+ or Zn2+ uptake regulation protein